MKENAISTNLESFIDEVKGNELLLPDFQRGFVWKVEEQKRLVASVLARMPIGSILGLVADADDYGYRILGRKDEPSIPSKENICILLDGQQRMTALTNIFSNIMFYDYSGSGELMLDYSKIASTDLQNRFFLEIPSIDILVLEPEEDLFHLFDLKAPLDGAENEVPHFLTKDILKYIHTESYNKKTTEAFAPDSKETGKISKFCIQNDRYLIPLYLLINDTPDSKLNENRLKQILQKIVDEVVEYRLENQYDLLHSQEDKNEYIRNLIEDDAEEILEISDESDKRSMFSKKWSELGKIQWAQSMFSYLKGCIRNLDLHQIKVEKSERNRAIDIYENLNMGGVTLSTFELILAKAAKKKNDERKNLFQMIVEYLQESKEYKENAILPDDMVSTYEEFRKTEQDYSATERMGCYDEKKNQLSSKYTDVFLNVLSLLCNAPDYNTEKIEVSLIKRDKILDLDAEQIMNNYKKACIGIDRACFFLQIRCGVRKIQEINYNLLLVLLGYILASDEYYKNGKIVRLLEAWYWCAIFSGRYDKDQTVNVVEDIKNVLNTIETGEKVWIREMQKKVFNMQDFSDKDTLLLKKSIVPKVVLRKAICQFYLAQNGMDLMTDEKLNVFSPNANTFEEHHIVPIGMLKNQTYKKMEKDKRNDKKSIFNSPLNFVLITKESNIKISNQDLVSYVKHCDDRALYSFKIELPEGIDNVGVKEIEVVLERRFNMTKSEVIEKIEKCI